MNWNIQPSSLKNNIVNQAEINDEVIIIIFYRSLFFDLIARQLENISAQSKIIRICMVKQSDMMLVVCVRVVTLKFYNIVALSYWIYYTQNTSSLKATINRNKMFANIASIENTMRFFFASFSGFDQCTGSSQR
ncbi:UNKNOWN [Stylonychia lemnae]|uniref:Uncharacterized protein n=1 Tax=Stylonychia lemnae TaxID=5949 RepID=A0A078AIX2_STYLE|nr:UNKNOWN [Stylonychia lemnae]|eukprot:CDW80753.1 UNKNOWN [Stylonychia lemnae]